jgi:23S rRNA (uridine2552-2'-O)-methyltransferase
MPRHRPQDHFGRRAREQGFPARSIYKLEEIDRRLRLLRPGLRVLDLGAAPGSWSLYAAERVGPAGRVLGVDKQAITVGAPAQLEFRQLDLEAIEPDVLGGPGSFDVVLSDMAPHTSGQRHRDQYLSFELYMRALHFASALLVDGGHYVGKIFQGPELEAARKATRELLGQVRIFKPEASRRESYEIYLAGGGVPRAPI